jgi:hypothetical protein
VAWSSINRKNKSSVYLITHQKVFSDKKFFIGRLGTSKERELKERMASCSLLSFINLTVFLHKSQAR